MASFDPMKQASLDLNLNARKTLKQVFLDQVYKVVPWVAPVELIAPYYSEGKTGRPPLELENMLRTHFIQQWFNLADKLMEEALLDTPLYREFAQLPDFGRLPDESTLLRFSHRLEKHKLADEILATVNELLEQRGLLLRAGSAADATLIAVPSSTKNKDKARDPDMHSGQKGNELRFGMKPQIGVDADSGLVHTVRGRLGNVTDVAKGNSLLLGQETDVFDDAGYQSVDKRPDAKALHKWHVAMLLGKRKKLDIENNLADVLLDRTEKIKAGIRAKVEHPFRVIKCQIGHVKVLNRGLKKNTLQIKTLFALSNLWMVRPNLVGALA